MNNKSVVVFSPHPDDETLGCGGTIAKKKSEGYDISIVEMTDGRFALRHLGILSNPTPEEMIKLRRIEVQKALKILGVKEQGLIHLDFQDSSLALNEDLVKIKILSILERKQPSEVFIPFSKDLNPDHQMTNKIVRSAIRASGAIITTYEYSICRINSRTNLVYQSFIDLFNGRLVRVDISNFVELKKLALNAFTSQITLISSMQKQPVLSSSFIKKHLKKDEVFYKV